MTGAARPERRWPWMVCVIAGVVMIGALAAFAAIPGQAACDGDAALGAMFRFEWAVSAAELDRLFGADPCRTTLANAMDAMNRIDVHVFIPAFTLFQMAAAWALRRDGRLLGILAFNLALIAAACDFLEDGLLVSMTAALRMDAPVAPAMLDQLFWLVRTKFALLALNGVIIGWLVGRRPGAGWRAAQGLMMIGGGIGLAGLLHPALLGPGIGLAWLTLLGVAVVRLIRPDPPPAN